MTKKIEDIFNLDDSDIETPKHKEIKSIDAQTRAVRKITNDLPQIAELGDLGEQELDELARKAEEAYDDLMDLGLNVEVRYSGRIFEVASSMLKNAIDAKATKIDKRLKAVELQLRRLKLEQDAKNGDDPFDGEGYVISDRNDLLKKLGKKE
jgi:hypothetical protein